MGFWPFANRTNRHPAWLRAPRPASAIARWIVVSIFALGPWLPSVAQDAGPITLPVAVHGVYVYVSATVNDKPVTLVLDSGAGINVIRPEAAKRLKLQPSKERTNVTGAGGSAPPVPTVVIGKLGVGTTRTADQPAALIPLPDALPCDGLIGTPLLKRWVVTVDYAKSRLTLAAPASFHPSPDAVAFPIRFKDGTPHIEASADGHKGWFMIDTGAGDSVTLFGPFVEKEQLRGKYSPAIKTVTGRGVGGLIYGEVTRLPEFTIGDSHLKRPTATLSQQTTGVFADREIAGNLGGEIWKRFVVTFDYPDQKVYLTPNGAFDAPFVYNRSGVLMEYSGGAFQVRAVLPSSPGSEAGVRPGDRVLAIDDRPAARIKPWEPGDLLQRDPGTRVRLKLRGADGAVRSVTLTLRDLL